DAWRRIERLHDTHTERARRFRGSTASYHERASAPSDDSTAAPALYRHEQRRRSRGLIDGLDPHQRRVRAARGRMLPERDILVVRPSPVEMLCDGLARAARWAHTVESQQRDAPAQAERRRLAEQQNGPARLIMGTPA